ncbi:MAG TPA: DUF4349 domain-containing protein [Candidatus Limnocylindrales bacterium]|nr:DUF4349 domain-containing protein [Candidatus Limnocylindrales bacterium]
MKTHPYDPETVMSYFDGELSSTEAADVAAHLHVCPDCFKLANDFVHVSGVLTKWQVEILPPGTTDAATLLKTKGRVSISGFFGWLRPSNRILVYTVAVGALSVLLFAIAVPNLIRSKMAANEASAVGSLRTLTTATIMYNDQYHHLPPSLESLRAPTYGQTYADAANLIDPTLASGSKSGYRFTYQPLGDRYTITAEAIEPEKSGTRLFSTDETGIIFSNGKPLGGESQVEKTSKTRLLDLERAARPPATMIARTVEFSIVVKDFARARTSMDALLARHRGYFAQLTVSGDSTSRGSLQASLRIPVPELDSAVTELKSFGRVEHESQSGEEVTMQHADIVARISNSREAESRLKDMLRTRTGKVADVLEVEQQISQTRGQIEQMEAELKALETRVDFATISLTLSTEFKDRVGELSPSASTRIRNASVSGYRDFRETVIGLLVWILASGPGIVLWAAIFTLPLLWIWRRWRATQNRFQAAA